MSISVCDQCGGLRDGPGEMFGGKPCICGSGDDALSLAGKERLTRPDPLSITHDESRLPEKYAGATPGPWKVLPTYWAGGSNFIQVDGHNTIWIDSDRGEIARLRTDGGRVTELTYANAHLIADAPQLAAENKALRKENAELKENFNDLRDENAELLSACGTNSAHTALKAIREIVADRDRLQEQVRLACWSSSLCSMHREPRGDCEICNGARLMAEKRREVAALQEQVRVLREAGKPFGDVATQVGGASLWLRFEQWGKTSGVEVTNECLVMRNALAATAEPTETKP